MQQSVGAGCCEKYPEEELYASGGSGEVFEVLVFVFFIALLAGDRIEII